MTKKQAFLLGMCAGVGLLLLVGFAQFPQAGDATPADLRPAYRELYLDLLARAYAADSSLDLQMFLGENWTPELSRTTLQALLDKTPTSAEAARGRIARLATVLEVSLTNLPPTTAAVKPSFPTNTPAPVPHPQNKTSKGVALAELLLILLLALGIALVGFRFMRSSASTAPEHVHEYKRAVPPTSWEGESTLPMLQFTTTYTLGDDRYDPSRSIETPKGQFLGECGVGMVSASKQGQSRLAPAFEVWLFDKNDIQTKTHVLLSEYVEQDEEARRRLVKENPASLVKPGLIVSLQTATLQLRAKVLDVQYLAHDQRFHCYFERLAVEIAVWQTQ